MGLNAGCCHNAESTREIVLSEKRLERASRNKMLSTFNSTVHEEKQPNDSLTNQTQSDFFNYGLYHLKDKKGSLYERNKKNKN